MATVFLPVCPPRGCRRHAVIPRRSARSAPTSYGLILRLTSGDGANTWFRAERQGFMRRAPQSSGVNLISQPLKVLLVEDSKILVERLTEAIRQIPAIDLVGIADTEASAIAFAERQAIDLI